MAGPGVRTSNLPLGALIEILGHADAGGGSLSLQRMAVGDFVNLLLGLASGSPSAVAQISADLTALRNAIEQQVFSLSTAILNEASYRTIADEALSNANNEEAKFRTFNDEQEIQARKAGDQAEADARRIAIEGVLEDMAVAEGINASRFFAALLAAVQGDRPGVAPAAFTASALGSIAASAPLDPNGIIASAFGPAFRLTGAGLIAPRASIPVDPDAIWVLKARYWRLVDVLDPNNSAVDLGIQWLDASDADCGITRLRRESTLSVQDGPRTLTVRVPSVAGDLPSIVPPKDAVSWRPYLRAYGGGAIAIGALGTHDATYAGVWAPDLEAVTARLRTIEGILTAGLPVSTQAPTSYHVADLPPVSSVSPGRRAWASDGRARQADGTLEPANGGTGVSVEDNGTRWVISGTNQQVQA